MYIYIVFAFFCIFCFKSMFPSESLDLQSGSWLVVCQGAWEHTFRNMFRSICQDVVFFSNQRAQTIPRFTPLVTNTQHNCLFADLNCLLTHLNCVEATQNCVVATQTCVVATPRSLVWIPHRHSAGGGAEAGAVRGKSGGTGPYSHPHTHTHTQDR